MFSIFGLFGPNLPKMYTERAVDVDMPSLLKDVGILEHGTACKTHVQRNLSKHAVTGWPAQSPFRHTGHPYSSIKWFQRNSDAVEVHMPGF